MEGLRRIGLVGCVKEKSSGAAPARDLYTSTLFLGRRRFVERTCERWYVLSALHGLVEPERRLEPYDKILKDASTAERRDWSARVVDALRRSVGELASLTFEIHAGLEYREFGLRQALEKEGARVDVPAEGLRMGEQLAFYRHHAGQSAQDLDRLYLILGNLQERLGGSRYLRDCDGRSGWPERGVYFFFDDREPRHGGDGPRVVRVGTHGLRLTDRTTLWGRLRNHKGSARGVRPGGGDHRGSVFRFHVGAALLTRKDDPLGLLPMWTSRSVSRVEGATREYEVEQEVSRYIGALPFLWIGVPDDPGPASDRGVIERNSIGLLSTAGCAIDSPRPSWLGHHAPAAAIGRSGLWNVRHVGDSYDPGFLVTLEHYVTAT